MQARGSGALSGDGSAGDRLHERIRRKWLGRPGLTIATTNLSILDRAGGVMHVDRKNSFRTAMARLGAAVSVVTTDGPGGVAASPARQYVP